MSSKIRLISYEENQQSNGEELLKNIQNNQKNFNKNIEKNGSKSLAIYRITPIISEDFKGLSYPTLKISENEHEIKEIFEKLSKSHVTNDIQNPLFLPNINELTRKHNKEIEEINSEFELKKLDEEEMQSRTPLDKYNLIKAFCISHDTYNNRLSLEENSNENDLKINNMEEKLNFLFDV